MFPPMLLYLRVGTPERPGPGIWLPIFLVWLILLPIIVLVLLITVLTDVALYFAGQSYHHYTLLLLRCFGVVGTTKGTVVSIRAHENVINMELV
jgi:hypothetical protein